MRQKDAKNPQETGTGGTASAGLWEVLSDFKQRFELVNAGMETSREIPAAVAPLVMDLAQRMGHLSERDRDQVDPLTLLSLSRALISCLILLEGKDARRRRRDMRIALEQVRQALEEIVGQEPVGEDRSPKAVAYWLWRTLDVPQEDLARLAGIGERTFQRWVSEKDPSEPHGDDASRLRVMARVANNLRHALTGPGVVRWFERPHPDLKGEPPVSMLAHVDRYPELVLLAARARSSGGS